MLRCSRDQATDNPQTRKRGRRRGSPGKVLHGALYICLPSTETVRQDIFATPLHVQANLFLGDCANYATSPRAMEQVFCNNCNNDDYKRLCLVVPTLLFNPGFRSASNLASAMAAKTKIRIFTRLSYSPPAQDDIVLVSVEFLDAPLPSSFGWRLARFASPN
jgi:hypothetical protein